MARKTCTNCLGRGYVCDILGFFLNPKNWIPFQGVKNPFVPCPYCNGNGTVGYGPWRSYSPRYRRKGG